VLNNSPEERLFNPNDVWDMPPHPNQPQLDYLQNKYPGYHSIDLKPATAAYPSPEEFPPANLPASEQIIYADAAHNYNISLEFIGPPEGSPSNDPEDYPELQEFLSNHSGSP
jgi:hypothetical protein